MFYIYRVQLRTLLFTVLICLCNSAFAQTTGVYDSARIAELKPKKILKEVKLQLRNSNYYDATDYLEIYLKKQPDNTDAAYMLAETYRFARDYKNAERWYVAVTENAEAEQPLATYYAALMKKMNGKYAEAGAMFEEFGKKARGVDYSYRKWALLEADGCKAALEDRQHLEMVNVFHLGDSVNSPYTDISPLLWNDTTLLFASLPSDTIIRVNDKDTSATKHYVQFYNAVKVPEGYKQAELFSKFNYNNAHTANGALSADGDRFYFSKCVEDEQLSMVCGLYVSEWLDSTWQEPVSLGSQINLPNYTSTQPTVGVDKRGQDIIYFSSNRPAGRGGMDIWYVQRSNTGQFGAPHNAGSRINTDRDEVTPYCFGDTLFFSSNGHISYGGYDIHYTTGALTRWDKPEHMGFPINGPTDDMYYYLLPDGLNGYFVSNRPGIISVKSETCCDDLFQFERYTRKVIAVKGYVYDEDDTTRTPIDNAQVTIFTPVKPGEELSIELGKDTTKNGQVYFFDIDFDKEYRLRADAAGYLSGSASFDSYGIIRSDTLHVDIYLKKFKRDKAYALQNIYYQYDKWFLRDTAQVTLDSLYQIMIDNPTIIVELGSHTDSRATDYYNLVLSQKRAESAMMYLYDKGIPANRLSAKGYGETQHLEEDCELRPGCPVAGPGDCPCHQLNRRTEFKIIGQLDAPLEYKDLRYEDVVKKRGKNKRKKDD